MNTIEILQKTWLSLQPLKSELQHRMDQQFMFDFNYNSNHLEGNTLTYGQTRLLLLFGRTEGEALMRDYEEMKAHNVGLELMKREARDVQRSLSEHFIRELNSTILVGDFYKTSRDGEYRYKIHAGVYKTRPNSVITPSGARFDYASPEETPALMAELVSWYRAEEQQKRLSVVELATLFHYRYIRIHPFEDGNGRIARLLVNYILHRHDYPMVVIPTADRVNYLNVLAKCDKITGASPFDGANATIEQVKPFVDYIAAFLERKLNLVISFAKEEIREFSESYTVNNEPNKNADNQDNKNNIGGNEPNDDTNSVVENFADKRQKLILRFIKMNNKVSREEIAKLLKASLSTIKRDFKQMQDEGIIERMDGTRGYWEIKN
jgi:Fic family protein